MKNYRPDDWPKCPCDECDRKVIDDYGYFCDLACGERTAWLNREAGADAILKAIMEARPSDGEIRVKIIEALYGGTSVPELENWLKERLLLKP